MDVEEYTWVTETSVPCQVPGESRSSTRNQTGRTSCGPLSTGTSDFLMYSNEIDSGASMV